MREVGRMRRDITCKPKQLDKQKYYALYQTLYNATTGQYVQVRQSAKQGRPQRQATQCQASTTLYYTVLLQYYSVLHRSTPVQLCTTKYYSSTTLYYKVLLRYHSLYYKVRLCKARRTNVAKCCACHEKSYSKITKHCPCHAKWLSWLMSLTYETSFTMRGATSITLQPHKILRLPRKIALQNLREICRKRLKRHLDCANDSTMNPNPIRAWTRHLAPARSLRLLFALRRRILYWNFNISRSGYLPRFHRILCLPGQVTLQHHQMLRLPRKVTLRHHQILPLPHKMTLMIDVRRICNVIYNVRNTRHHPPTSPNTAPATRNCIPKSLDCANDSTMNPNPIRAWIRHLAPARSLSLLFALRRRILYWKLQHFALRLSTQISPNTVPATKSDAPTSPNAAPATKSDTPTSPNTAPATKSDTPRSPNAAPATKSDAPRSPNTAPALKRDTEALLYWAETLLSCYFTELLLYGTVTLLRCYLTELLLYWAVTSLSCYFTALLLYWAVTLLSCYFAELLLDWAVTLLSCSFTELLLYWAVTVLSCYFTEPLLYWAVTLLSCYFTELLLYWAVTLLSCYFTELLLYWTVTLLSCSFTELLLYWAVTLLSCYFTELLLYWTLCIFKSP